MVALLVGALVLPLLLWSWWRTGNDEDASLALGIIGWLGMILIGILLFLFVWR